MSDSMQERTEAATPRRRQEAREKGQVARSQEVSSALLLLAAAGTLHVATGGLGGELASIFRSSAGVSAAPPAGVQATAGWVQGLGFRTLAALAPVVLGISGMAVVAAAVQARGTFSTKAMEADWGRISPLKNGKRLLGLRPWVDLVKSLAKFAIVAGAVYYALSRAWGDLLALGQESPVALLFVTRGYAVRMLLTAGLAFLVLAAADYLYQVWDFEKGLRMSREEVKREQKDSEGDPMIKARLRSIGRSLARRRMMTDVPTADVVVTNPTHIAVALRYDPTVAAAPIVVAMGQRKIAQRIKKLALESGVPIIEDRPLARALLATARIGLPIPPDLYVAVAEVLAFVIRGRGGAGRRMAEVLA